MASPSKITRGINAEADAYREKLQLLSYRTADPSEDNREISAELQSLSVNIWQSLVLKHRQREALEKTVSVLRASLQAANTQIAQLKEDKDKAIALADFYKDEQQHKSTQTTGEFDEEQSDSAPSDDS